MSGTGRRVPALPRLPRMALPRVRRWRHWTLRARLAVVVAGLTAVAVLVSDGAGLVLLKSYLLHRVDGQLTAGAVSSVLDEKRLRQLEQGPLANPRSTESLLARRYNGHTRIYLADRHGTRVLLAADPTAPGPELPDRAELARHVDGAPFTVPGEHGGAEWRVYVRLVRTGAGSAGDRADAGSAGHGAGAGSDGDGAGSGGAQDPAVLVLASSLAEVTDTYDRLLLIDVGVLVAVLILLGAAAALVVRVGLRPLTRMEATADAIAAGDFGQRVPGADRHTEPGRLGRAMNAMLGRVESEITARTASEHRLRASEQRLRRFFADASHELRTPLTSIRGFAELCRRGGDPADALRRIEDEARRMGVLVDDLLLLARLDEARDVARAPVDLLELCADMVREAHARAPERTVRLVALDAAGGLLEPVVVSGDAARLRQVIGNLLTNAERHTPPAAGITVRLGSVRTLAAPGRVAARVGAEPAPEGPVAVVEVADTGPGVAPEHAPHVFERLYRADAARTGGGGNGLGLSIAAAQVQAHGGRIELDAPAPGRGATFRVVLPLA